MLSNAIKGSCVARAKRSPHLFNLLRSRIECTADDQEHSAGLKTPRFFVDRVRRRLSVDDPVHGDELVNPDIAHG
jgi:hypothetical protein